MYKEFQSDVLRGGSVLRPETIIIDRKVLIWKKRNKNLITVSEIIIPINEITSIQHRDKLIGSDLIISSRGGERIEAVGFKTKDVKEILYILRKEKSSISISESIVLNIDYNLNNTKLKLLERKNNELTFVNENGVKLIINENVNLINKLYLLNEEVLDVDLEDEDLDTEKLKQEEREKLQKEKLQLDKEKIEVTSNKKIAELKEKEIDELYALTDLKSKEIEKTKAAFKKKYDTLLKLEAAELQKSDKSQHRQIQNKYKVKKENIKDALDSALERVNLKFDSQEEKIKKRTEMEIAKTEKQTEKYKKLLAVPALAAKGVASLAKNVIKGAASEFIPLAPNV